MESSAKARPLQQKSYRKGSSLYFSAGLVLSMVLVVTAFEWKTTFLLSENGPIEIEEWDNKQIIDFQPVTLPVPPKPKVLSPNISTTPDPVITEQIIDEPPVVEEPTEPVDATRLTDGLFSGTPTEETPTTARFSRAAVPANGLDAFNAYIFDRLRVPQHLIQQHVNGRVVVSFVIDTNGELTDIQIVEGLDKQLEKQIIKILQEAPAWEPAWKDGKKAKAYMQLPIVIKVTH